MAKKSNKKLSHTNRNAIVRTRRDRTGKLRTETARRDDGIDIAVSTDTRNNRTTLFFDLLGRNDWRPADFELTGREVRTLYRALTKHFKAKRNANYR